MLEKVPSNTTSKREPLHLQILKHHLANHKCNCTYCRKEEEPSIYKRVKGQRDEQAQTEEFKVPDENNPTISISALKVLYDIIDKANLNRFFSRDVVCMGCLQKLHGGTTKVVKDGWTETLLNCVDKSSEKIIPWSEKTTSTPYIEITHKQSKTTVCNIVSECYEGKKDHVSTPPSKFNKKIEVRFVEVEAKMNPEVLNRDQKINLTGICSCLDEFVNSIRPPEDLRLVK